MHLCRNETRIAGCSHAAGHASRDQVQDRACQYLAVGLHAYQ